MGGTNGKEEEKAEQRMMMGVRMGIEIMKEEKVEVKDLISKVIKLTRGEGKAWRIVGVYVNGDLKEKWEKLGIWAEDSSKGIKTMVRGNFNARTGTFGGWWEGGEGREDEKGRRSMNGKVSKESRWLIGKLEEVEYIFNGCRGGRWEESLDIFWGTGAVSIRLCDGSRGGVR